MQLEQFANAVISDVMHYLKQIHLVTNAKCPKGFKNRESNDLTFHEEVE